MTFSVEWNGGTISGEDEESVRDCIAQLEESKRRGEERDRRFPGTNRQQMTALCRLFPTLADQADGIDPWDAQKFALWVVGTGCCRGAVHAARFVLQVWNSSANWIEILKEESTRPQPEDPTDRVLWNGVQRLKAEARKDLLQEAQEDARDQQRRPQPVTDAQIEKRLFGYFETLQPFNVCDAFGTWDRAHRKAFLAWAEYPFWP